MRYATKVRRVAPFERGASIGLVLAAEQNKLAEFVLCDCIKCK